MQTKKYTLKRKENRIDVSLKRRQPAADRIYNIEKEINYIDAMKNSELFGAEEIRAEELFLKKLVFETNIYENAEKKQNKMPKFVKEKMEKKINRLKEDANYWKETLDKQKKELVKYQKLKDKDNYKITLMAIKEIERHYQKIISKLEFFIRQLNVINNKN